MNTILTNNIGQYYLRSKMDWKSIHNLLEHNLIRESQSDTIGSSSEATDIKTNKTNKTQRLVAMQTALSSFNCRSCRKRRARPMGPLLT